MRVKSKNIYDITHDPIKNELHVTFHNGQTYIYHDVPAKSFVDLMNSRSIGQHFATHIKPKHIFRKIFK